MEKTFVDTNYFVRFLLKDQPKQLKKAESFLLRGARKELNLFTSTLVIFEVYWILTSYYKKTKEEALAGLAKILKLRFIEIGGRETLTKAVFLCRESGLTLEDCHHLFYTLENKGQDLATFDRKLKREFNKHAKS